MSFPKAPLVRLFDKVGSSVPGPGTYDPKSTGNSARMLSFNRDKQARFVQHNVNNVPGPGSYNPNPRSETRPSRANSLRRYQVGLNDTIASATDSSFMGPPSVYHTARSTVLCNGRNLPGSLGSSNSSIPSSIGTSRRKEKPTVHKSQPDIAGGNLAALLGEAATVPSADVPVVVEAVVAVEELPNDGLKTDLEVVNSIGVEEIPIPEVVVSDGGNLAALSSEATIAASADVGSVVEELPNEGQETELEVAASVGAEEVVSSGDDDLTALLNEATTVSSADLDNVVTEDARAVEELPNDVQETQLEVASSVGAEEVSTPEEAASDGNLTALLNEAATASSTDLELVVLEPEVFIEELSSDDPNTELEVVDSIGAEEIDVPQVAASDGNLTALLDEAATVSAADFSAVVVDAAESADEIPIDEQKTELEMAPCIGAEEVPEVVDSDIFSPVAVNDAPIVETAEIDAMADTVQIPDSTSSGVSRDDSSHSGTVVSMELDPVFCENLKKELKEKFRALMAEGKKPFTERFLSLSGRLTKVSGAISSAGLAAELGIELQKRSLQRQMAGIQEQTDVQFGAMFHKLRLMDWTVDDFEASIKQLKKRLVQSADLQMQLSMKRADVEEVTGTFGDLTREYEKKLKEKRDMSLNLTTAEMELERTRLATGEEDKRMEQLTKQKEDIQFRTDQDAAKMSVIQEKRTKLRGILQHHQPALVQLNLKKDGGGNLKELVKEVKGAQATFSRLVGQQNAKQRIVQTETYVTENARLTKVNQALSAEIAVTRANLRAAREAKKEIGTGSVDR